MTSIRIALDAASPIRLVIPHRPLCFFFFFFNDTAPPEIYTLSLHDALPISGPGQRGVPGRPRAGGRAYADQLLDADPLSPPPRAELKHLLNFLSSRCLSSALSQAVQRAPSREVWDGPTSGVSPWVRGPSGPDAEWPEDPGVDAQRFQEGPGVVHGEDVGGGEAAGVLRGYRGRRGLGDRVDVRVAD